MKKILFFSCCTIFLYTACVSTSKIQQANTGIDHYASAKVFMAAYQQKAAEYRALCYQAYNAATWQLPILLKNNSSKPPAIMTDIDETILDNSPYQVHQSLQGKDYDPKTWHEWTARADADTVPGALRFFQYAASQGAEIFYVTNRDLDEKQSTLENMKKFGFPYADEAHLKLKSTTSSKVPRRDSIMMTHHLIMQVGDNLNDLNGQFEKGDIDKRFLVADQLRKDFGTSLIVLPNPSYGEWENALYHYKLNLTSAQKDSIFRVILKNY